tara:strand:- start:89 stop:262 length:174 start_codon:yes stop_codon:yes gene_type:complete
MLSKDSRLRLSEICCRIKLGRNVTLEERIWMHKLIKCNKSALGIAERIISPYKIGDI